MLSEFLIFVSSLFHYCIVEGKYEFLKNSGFTLHSGIVSEFRVIYHQLYGEGIMLKQLLALREKCTNTEIFLVGIFPHLD